MLASDVMARSELCIGQQVGSTDNELRLIPQLLLARSRSLAMTKSVRLQCSPDHGARRREGLLLSTLRVELWILFDLDGQVVLEGRHGRKGLWPTPAAERRTGPLQGNDAGPYPHRRGPP